LDKSGNEYDCKSVFRIVSAEAYNGAKFTIQVQGQDEKAEHYALRIYSALTSKDSFNMNFYRFEKDDDRQKE